MSQGSCTSYSVAGSKRPQQRLAVPLQGRSGIGWGGITPSHLTVTVVTGQPSLVGGGGRTRGTTRQRLVSTTCRGSALHGARGTDMGSMTGTAGCSRPALQREIRIGISTDKFSRETLAVETTETDEIRALRTGKELHLREEFRRRSPQREGNTNSQQAGAREEFRRPATGELPPCPPGLGTREGETGGPGVRREGRAVTFGGAGLGCSHSFVGLLARVGGEDPQKGR